MQKYMSIITNFGCHYKCPYCIVKNNNLHIPCTTLNGLNSLKESLKNNNCNIISISGGGDPLYNYQQHIEWYEKLFSIAKECNLPVEMHTSYMTDESAFPFRDCFRVVYHANTVDQLSQICRTGSEIVRVVYVVTENFTIEDVMCIAKFVNNSENIQELTFRQLVDENYKNMHYLEDYMRLGHKKLWYYVEQKDYNLYYAENDVYHEYKQFKTRR